MVVNKIIRHFRTSFLAEEYIKKAKTFKCVRSVSKYMSCGHYAVMLSSVDSFPSDVYETLVGKSTNYALQERKR